jgi:hypothetical protein
MFGSELVMSAAEPAQVVGLGAAALAVRLPVIELEPGPAATAHAMGVDPAAAETIAFEHRAASSAGDVRAARLGCGMRR